MSRARSSEVFNKLQILLLCFPTFRTEGGGENSIELNLSDHILNSNDLTN